MTARNTPDSSAQGGNGAEAQRNGRDPFADDLSDLAADFRKAPRRPGEPAAAATAFPMLMVAHHLGAEPGDEIAQHVTDPAAWESLRTFGARYGISIVAPNPVTERDGTRFEELDAVPHNVAVLLCPDLDGTSRAEVAEFVAESVLYDMADPEAALAQLTQEADARKRERSRRQQALKKVSVAPHTTYSLAEVERGCGAAVGDAARQLVERHNRDTWNMGAAARKTRREEHTYLVTAAELVGLGVEPETIKAALTAASPEDHSAAWAELADARVRHKAGIAEDKNPVSRRWLDAKGLASLPEWSTWWTSCCRAGRSSV